MRKISEVKTCVVCGNEFAYEPKPGRPPVTCSPECHQVRRSRQTQESHNRIATRKVPPGKHGTPTGYATYGCHCRKCRRRSREDQRARRAAARSDTDKTSRIKKQQASYYQENRDAILEQQRGYRKTKSERAAAKRSRASKDVAQ